MKINFALFRDLGFLILVFLITALSILVAVDVQLSSAFNRNQESLTLTDLAMLRRNLALTVGGIFALFSIISVIIVAQRITVVARMIDVAIQLALGELPAPVYVEGINRMGVLAQSFARMCEVIQQTLAKYQQSWTTQQLTQYSVDNSSVAIFWITSEGHLQYINDMVCQMLGYTREEVLALSVNDLGPFWSAEAWDANWEWLKREKSTIFRALLRRKDGTTFPAEVSASYLEFSGQEYLFAFVADVEDRQQAEAERSRLVVQVREQMQRVQGIINTVPEGVLLLDEEKRVEMANPAGERILMTLAGIQVKDVLLSLGDCPLDELLTSPPEGLWHELTVEARAFQVIARTIEVEPAVEPAMGGWVMVIRDVTQQRELAQHAYQQQRLATVGQMAAGIAHDFNNIMAVIILYCQMALREPGISAKLRDRLAVVQQQGMRASELIEQILDFGRRAVLDRRPLDMLSLLKEQVKLLQRTFPEHIRVKLYYDADSYMVHADPTRLQQVLMNLALNARDAMPEGGELLFALDYLSIGPEHSAPLPDMPEGLWLCIRVTDTGMGIPLSVLPHIFDPFFTTKAPDKGTGLGLSQVYGIITQHDGFVDVQSQVGVGSTFMLYLPALQVKTSSSLTPQFAELPLGHGETILVVEDNAVTRDALVGSLEILNYTFVEAVNGQEALRLFSQDREAGGDSAESAPRDIALVLTDMVMPRMGGKALAQMLRHVDPEVPIILLTGHPLEQEIESLKEIGVTTWLQKPPTLEQLAGVIGAVLGGQV